MKLVILYITLLLSTYTLSHGQNNKTSSNSNTKLRINNYLESCESNGFNGSVLVVKNDEVILNKGYGFANKEDSIPNISKTIFDIGSVTKQFTAAAILKLSEEGKLKITTPLSLYFKDLPLNKKNITIHQLLTHSAGFDHGIGESDFDHIPQDDYFKQLFDTELLFQPGEKFSYSNSGYSILGRIIELASGKGYENYLKEKLFDPAGMKQTGYLLPKWDSRNISNEYMCNAIANGSQISKYKRDGKISLPLKANGGINSSQEDMYKWYLALKNHKVLSKSSFEELTKPQIIMHGNS